MVYPIAKLTISPFYKLWLRKVEGKANIPKDKPFILAANHSSYYETLLLPIIIISEVNKKIHPMVNSYYWRNFATRIIMAWGECIPVFVEKENSSKKKNEAAFQKALKYLKNNELIMIFPEGKRSQDGKLQKAYNGIARLALASNIPVLPIGIIGADKVMPKGAMLPRFARCEVKIGELMYFEKYYGKNISKKALEDVTRKVMNEIAKLIGQEYTY